MAKASARKTPRPQRLAAPRRPETMAKSFTSEPVAIEFADASHRFVRADLEINGIAHGEASYEGRIFLDNPKANAKTPKTIEEGYAGSFNIFGHGGCLGDPGHCDINEHNRDPYDFRAPHPLTLASKRVTVTAALRAAARTKKKATITIVPVVTAANDLCDTKDVFHFERMQFVTYNG
ncbi:MAG TPA: hypothetical protein VNU97_07235 [Rhizomicrobium sp.]|jgi:hypothetical protein|nr:hypothetical protein [Rhizomicrobium sp.]